MKGLAFLLVSLPLATAWTGSQYGKRSIDAVQKRDVDPELLYPEHNFSVPIDHFKNESMYEPHTNETFQLRYWFDASHYKTGGPLLMDANITFELYWSWPSHADGAAAQNRIYPAVLCINTPQELQTRWGKITGLPRPRPRDFTLCAGPALSFHGAKQNLCGEEMVVWLRQGDNTCWLDAMLVAMRMQGIGRFVYDVSAEEDTIKSRVLELLCADWSHDINRLDDLRDAVQHSIAQVCPELNSGAYGNPGDLWDHGAAGIPSVSFNTAKKKICTTCESPNYAQGPQDRVCSIQLLPGSGNGLTLPQLLNNHFANQAIERHRPRFSTCQKCNEPLPLNLKLVVVDRLPFILCVGVNISVEARSRKALPNFAPAQDLLHGFDLSYETFRGSTRTARYVAVAIVYLKQSDHWVSANRVRIGKIARWIVCDGGEAGCTIVDDAAIEGIIKGGRAARFLMQRVYKEVTKEGILN